MFSKAFFFRVVKSRDCIIKLQDRHWPQEKLNQGLVFQGSNIYLIDP